MGCDIHMTLERCRRRVDEATKRARYKCLILAKRAAKQREAVQGVPNVELPSELWERVATLVTVTSVVVDWVPCQYLEWVTADDATWARLHAEHEKRAGEAYERLREELDEDYVMGDNWEVHNLIT